MDLGRVVLVVRLRQEKLLSSVTRQRDVTALPLIPTFFETKFFLANHKLSRVL
jgi:hypothetical protein